VTLKKVRTFLCVKILKWKRDNNNQDMNELSIKMSKVMFVFVTLSANEKNSVIKFNIFMFIIYTEAVRNSIWEEMWKNTIHVKLTVLMTNET